jgi:hypothetical protein
MNSKKFLQGLFEAMNPTKPFKPEITTRAIVKAYSPAHLEFEVSGKRYEGEWDAIIHSPKLSDRCRNSQGHGTNV